MNIIKLILHAISVIVPSAIVAIFFEDANIFFIEFILFLGFFAGIGTMHLILSKWPEEKLSKPIIWLSAILVAVASSIPALFRYVMTL